MHAGHTLSRSIGYITECSFSHVSLSSVSSDDSWRSIPQYQRMRRRPCWQLARNWEEGPRSCEIKPSAPVARIAASKCPHRILIFVILNQTALVVHGSHLVWLGHGCFNLAGGRHSTGRGSEGAEKAERAGEAKEIQQASGKREIACGTGQRLVKQECPFARSES